MKAVEDLEVRGIDNMMIESITKHGVLYGKKLEFCCPVCGCEFTKMATDSRTLIVYPRTNDFVFEVRCPECGMEFTRSVSKEELSD